MWLRSEADHTCDSSAMLFFYGDSLDAIRFVEVCSCNLGFSGTTLITNLIRFEADIGAQLPPGEAVLLRGDALPGYLPPSFSSLLHYSRA